MTQLSRQTIRKFCLLNDMITPFQPHKRIVNGKSGGLSADSYDCHIDHDLTLGVMSGELIAEHLIRVGDLQYPQELVKRLHNNPPFRSLAHTVEDFQFPNQITGALADKSTYARVFVTCLNTHFDAGFHGNATLELINFGPEPIHYKAGDPVCQMLFTFLDEPTEKPYNGRYQNQTKTIDHNPARYENEDGTWRTEK